MNLIRKTSRAIKSRSIVPDYVDIIKLRTVNSIEALKKVALFDDQVIKALEKRSCDKLLKSVQTLMGKAEETAMVYEKKLAYVYYIRAEIVCSLINNHASKHTFFKTDNGSLFKEMFTAIAANIESLGNELKTFYNDRQMAMDIAEIEILGSYSINQGETNQYFTSISHHPCPSAPPLLPDPDKNSDNSNSTICVICFINERKVVLLPCRHFVVCQNCVTKVTDCPICRQKFNNFMGVFM